jgi:amidase
MNVWVGQSVSAIAEAVRSGEVSAREVVAEHIARIERLDERLNAFVRVRDKAALAEAEAIDASADRDKTGAAPAGGRAADSGAGDREPDDSGSADRDPGDRETGADSADRPRLPLAGVPIAIKDNVPVAGEPMRHGSAVTPDTPQEEDHPVVERLRAAGAVVVGLTTLPEFGLYAVTDSAYGIARTPWDTGRSAGGSSGGAAAAVAAAMVPAAHGNDGLGSIRIPAANCGLFGIRPGPGVVPAQLGGGWAGLAENGPLATTVTDAALMLSVMADDSTLARVAEPARPLRVAVSVKPTAPGNPIRPDIKAAVRETAEVLARAGHMVTPASPGYPIWSGPATLGRWLAAGVSDVTPYDLATLEKRTRRHVRAGRLTARLMRPLETARARLRGRFAPFFERFDVLVMPTLAQLPPPAVRWGDRGLAHNVLANVRYAPMTGIWNLAGYPAAAVPAGVGETGLPLSVQLVATPGRESLLLSLAYQLERLRPWRRHEPDFDPA